MILNILSVVLVIIVTFTTVDGAKALETVKMQPMNEVINTSVRDCNVDENWRVPMIAWGADIRTVHANGNSQTTTPNSLFGERGLNVDLYREDDFIQQVEDYLTCETPFLRGTLGMLNAAAQVTEGDPRSEMVVIYQLSWSAGGDAIVVGEGINNIEDLRGKTIGVQAYGPHVDYVSTILDTANIRMDEVNIVYYPDLFQTGPSSSSAAMALQDGSVDAAAVILPDALMLTSGGTVGTGAEGSVYGSKILMTTKTASRVIADVYGVRRDFFEQNREKIRDFAHAMMIAEEHVRGIVKQEGSSEYYALMTSSSELLLDDSNAIEDMHSMYLDAEHSGWSQNVKFFSVDNLLYI